MKKKKKDDSGGAVAFDHFKVDRIRFAAGMHCCYSVLLSADMNSNRPNGTNVVLYVLSHHHARPASVLCRPLVASAGHQHVNNNVRNAINHYIYIYNI